MRIRSAFLAILALGAASCSDSTTEPTVGASGSLSFTYTGAGAVAATQYSANGAVPANISVNNGSSSWAAGGIDAASNGTIIAASVPRTSTTWDLTLIGIDRTTAGSSTINPSCTANNCTGITIIFGSSQSESSYTYLCDLTSGTVNISSISSTNATGSFSGSGTCVTAAGATSNFVVTSGTFNVGITSQLQ